MPYATSKRCSVCGRRTGARPDSGRDVCRACSYDLLLPLMRSVDLPAAPVGERYAALCDVAPYWAVARFVGGVDPRIVRRQALLYTSATARAAEVEAARPDPAYVKRCSRCGQPRHLAPTCPLERPDRNER